MAGRIESVAATLGIRVHATEGDAWELSEGTVTMGTGRYERHGLTGDALVAAIMLDVWASVRLPHSSHTRTTHRRALTREQPQLALLLDTIDRVQAGGELLIAFPGFGEGLGMSVRARFHGDLREATEPAQWLTMTLLDALAPGSEYTVSDAVFQARIDPHLLHAAMDPVLPPNPQRTFARLLGLLAPPYQALLGTQDPGLGEPGAQPGMENQGAGGDPLAQPSHEDITAGPDAIEGGGAETQPNPEADDPAQEARHPTTAPHHAPDEISPTSVLEHMLQLPRPASHTTPGAPRVNTDTSVSPSPQAHATTAHEGVSERARQRLRLGEYRDRVTRLEPEINRIRELWQQLVSEQLSVHHGWDRVPQSEGDTLHRAALPAAIAEAQAGVPRPRAYTRRYRNVREREGLGHTDIVFLVDRSGSMRSARQAATDAVLVMTEALAAVTRDVRDTERRFGVDLGMGIRTSLIIFDSDPVVVAPLSATVDDEARARFIAESLHTQGGTHDAAALEEAATQLEILGARPGHRIPRRRLVVMISDGGSQEPDRAAATLQFLRDRGVTVFGVSVQSDALLQRYAPDARRVDDPRDIVRVLEALVTKVAAPGRSGHAMV